jgi:hypothetical protein
VEKGRRKRKGDGGEDFLYFPLTLPPHPPTSKQSVDRFIMLILYFARFVKKKGGRRCNLLRNKKWNLLSPFLSNEPGTAIAGTVNMPTLKG